MTRSLALTVLLVLALAGAGWTVSDQHGQMGAQLATLAAAAPPPSMPAAPRRRGCHRWGVRADRRCTPGIADGRALTAQRCLHPGRLQPSRPLPPGVWAATLRAYGLPAGAPARPGWLIPAALGGVATPANLWPLPPGAHTRWQQQTRRMLVRACRRQQPPTAALAGLIRRWSAP